MAQQQAPTSRHAGVTRVAAAPRHEPTPVAAAPLEIKTDGRSRAVIERVRPEVDGGRYPIKRAVGETVVVEADVFTDGHDALSCVVLYRHQETDAWTEVRLERLRGDRWQAAFEVTTLGRYVYTVVAWVDHFLTWRMELTKRMAAGQVTPVDLLIGANLIEEAAQQATGAQRDQLQRWTQRLRSADAASHLEQICDDPDLHHLMDRCGPRHFATTYDRELEVVVDRRKAEFSTWYEMFPRSAASEPGQHGTLRDCEARLAYVAAMGFDVLYLPPIHPIGETFRKGRDNHPEAGDGDVGSPWGIGGPAGGHKAIHSELGTLEDFQRLQRSAQQFGIELAMDVAFQCSPDHPYVKEHPEWFRHRPDGTIQYAENPPKKYQDIYPFDFETTDWQALWQELKSVFQYWIDQGVRIFRVDNPHTKPFAFWEWVIGEIKQHHPDVLFLAEAFTRPAIMYRLAKLGFTQSYTYFTWRNTKHELTQYFTELTQTDVREFFRPNLWPNTPDILTEYLQFGGRAAFMSRLVLAATLSASYGIYGPPFEHGWSKPRDPGSEEYAGSEKYEVHYHDLERSDSLKEFIGRVNQIRHEQRVLQSMGGLRFHDIDNEDILCYSKASDDFSRILLVVVNLDPHHKQSGWVELPLAEMQLPEDQPFQAHDLLSDARYLWHGRRNYVELDPAVCPAHVFQVRRRSRTERDFEYYL
ncbi:MAG: alpha-1,4-glucan--maltose-1-phosphate maltosyltransferase [Pirellulales bacterium]